MVTHAEAQCIRTNDCATPGKMKDDAALVACFNDPACKDLFMSIDDGCTSSSADQTCSSASATPSTTSCDALCLLSDGTTSCDDTSSCAFRAGIGEGTAFGKVCAKNALCKPIGTCQCSDTYAGQDQEQTDFCAALKASTPAPAAAAASSAGATATAVSATVVALVANLA